MTIFQVPFHQRQPVGDQLFTTTGTNTFTVPADVYFISAVCIGGGGGGGDGTSTTPTNGGGGGGLAWISNLPVTPGEVLTVTVGAGGLGGAATGTAGLSRIARGATNLVTANGGTNATNATNATATAGGTFTFDASVIGSAGIGTGGGVGGTGGNSTGTGNYSGGGGGAAGYSGNGGAGGNGVTASAADGASGSGGGGGGGEASDGTSNSSAGGGGGTNVDGEGPDGTGGTGNTFSAGSGGSGGDTGQPGGTGGTAAGGLYGAGGGGSRGGGIPGNGAQGAVRIIWGPNRAFPSTNPERSISVVATDSSADTSSITIPSTAQAGDIAILFDSATNTSSTTPPTLESPPDWTNLTNNGGSTTGFSIRMSTFYKILDSTDIETSIGGMLGTSRMVLVVVRPNFPCFSVTRPALQSSSFILTDPPSQTISLSTPESAGSLCIGFAHMRSSGNISRTVPSNFIEVVNGVQVVQYIVDNLNQKFGNQTVDMADSGTLNGFISFYVNFDGFYT